LTDETVREIAASYGVTRAALSSWLLRVAEDDWKEAQVARALARKESAEDAMVSAQNALDLARARELLKAAQWDLERVCRRIYGSDVPPDLASRISITINTVAAEQQIAVQHDQLPPDGTQALDVSD
jgi:hypothetical protein